MARAEHLDFSLFITVSLAILTIGLVFLTVKYLWRKHLHSRWRNHWQLNKHQPTFEDVYSEADAFACSLQARQKKDDMSYVYGEVEFESFVACISMVSPQPQERFLDLGSGSGKPVLASAMVFQLQAHGIELFPELNNLAKQSKQKLIAHPEYQDLSDSIHFHGADFLKTDWPDADIIFINATAFFGEIWGKICQRLDALEHCRMVITTTRPIMSTKWVLTHQSHCAMSWGVVDVYFQQPIDTFD